MSDSKKMHVLGYSGHAYVVIDSAQSKGIDTVGYFEKKESTQNPYRLKFIGDERDFSFHDFDQSIYFFPAVGKNSLRKNLIHIIKGNRWREIVLIDATAKISTNAHVLESTFVAPKAVINSLVTIGEGCIINSGAIIEHECKIGSYSHIAPGAILAGNVLLGEECFIGAGAVVREGVKIGDRVTVGTGAIVLKDIPSNETWVGNPARRIN
ncbi:MAG: acetyltransferase [Cyclobacteriaceae bacterium]|nr:acetyltransferase [Cyclobacteriaceae bacterium]